MRSASGRLSMDVAISRRPKPSSRHGIIVLLAALLLIVLVAMAAYHGEVCYILTAKFDVQRAVDARRLARAGTIVDGVAIAEGAARKIVRANSLGVIVPDSKSQATHGAPHVCSNQFGGGLAV